MPQFMQQSRMRHSSEIDLNVAGKIVANPLLIQHRKSHKGEQQSLKTGNYDTLKASNANEKSKP